ncbi:MAG: hypothetical protein EOP10_03440 [Proteobacteria bacterium]|nr:MAG: hypothetical protein EOP10_03440 [Pseudomonadota bacterium]
MGFETSASLGAADSQELQVCNAEICSVSELRLNVTVDLNKCPCCGRDNSCALSEAQKKACWCMSVPFELTVPIDKSTSCYCLQCLQGLTSE